MVVLRYTFLKLGSQAPRDGNDYWSRSRAVATRGKCVDLLSKIAYTQEQKIGGCRKSFTFKSIRNPNARTFIRSSNLR